ncbi:MAG: N-acetyltransferase [Bacteroidales bacterium]|nr:N-acetyltransferase [Bacteroidales bacterium]
MVEIKEVRTRRELSAFVNFPERLYRDNPYYIPPLVFDQMDTLDREHGAARAFCDSALYMAYKDGKPAGRVAAIVNRSANAQWNHEEVRFGWYDFIDDEEVSRALMDKVVEFGRVRGMDTIVGPLGFTDFDPEGMLVAGYDRESTMALIYNHPYCITHLERMGFRKDADWVEYRVFFGETLPGNFERLANIVQQRAGVHLRPLTRKIVRREHYGQKVFNLINECYKDLYNFTVLKDSMADKYLGFYLAVLDLRYLSMVENEQGELVAFGITMPSLAKALRKSRGRLFPFGWWYLLKSMFLRHEEGIEMLLIGVRPDYRNSGINTLLFTDLFRKVHRGGFKWAETNAILEDNQKNRLQWEKFDHECVKRRRSYTQKLQEYDDNKNVK